MDNNVSNPFYGNNWTCQEPKNFKGVPLLHVKEYYAHYQVYIIVIIAVFSLIFLYQKFSQRVLYKIRLYYFLLSKRCLCQREEQPELATTKHDAYISYSVIVVIASSLNRRAQPASRERTKQGCQAGRKKRVQWGNVGIDQ